MSPTPSYVEQPKRSGLLTALVAGAIVVLIGANIYLYTQIDHMRTDMSAMHDKLMTEISNMRDASTVTSASQLRHVEALKEELAASAFAGAARIEPGEAGSAGARGSTGAADQR